MSATLSALIANRLGATRRTVLKCIREFIARLPEDSSLPAKYEPRRLLDLDRPVLSLESANRYISRRILGGQPTMVSRFGESELRATLMAQSMNDWAVSQRLYWAATRLELPKWSARRFEFLSSTGFFPTDRRPEIMRFKSLIEQSSSQANLLGSWVYGENLVARFPSGLKVASLGALEPFFAADPWTKALAGKVVLVIHPFVTSIRSQFERRHRIFGDTEFLPDFNLVVLAPPVTFPDQIHQLGESGASFFSELSKLEARVSAIEFDVAIIGAGAYGMPLAAFVKSIGKCAIHLGGATQLLFGIWGARWDAYPAHRALKNRYWTRPLPDERPSGWESIERGAYW